MLVPQNQFGLMPQNRDQELGNLIDAIGGGIKAIGGGVKDAGEFVVDRAGDVAEVVGEYTIKIGKKVVDIAMWPMNKMLAISVKLGDMLCKAPPGVLAIAAASAGQDPNEGMKKRQQFCSIIAQVKAGDVKKLQDLKKSLPVALSIGMNLGKAYEQKAWQRGKEEVENFQVELNAELERQGLSPEARDLIEDEVSTNVVDEILNEEKKKAKKGKKDLERTERKASPRRIRRHVRRAARQINSAFKSPKTKRTVMRASRKRAILRAIKILKAQGRTDQARRMQARLKAEGGLSGGLNGSNMTATKGVALAFGIGAVAAGGYLAYRSTRY